MFRSPFESSIRPAAPGTSPEEIQAQIREFKRRGGKIQVIPGGQNNTGELHDYSKYRERAQKNPPRRQPRGGDDLPPSAA